MFLGQLAPAGTRIGTGELLRTLLASRTDATATLARRLRERYGVRHVHFVSSGRAALVLLLKTLVRLGDPDRREVIVPGYTCYSVPAAVVRAGLRVRVCDVDPTTLSYDPAALAATDFSRVLAIVSANLYGLPNDLPAIEALARRHGVFFVDDAAQGLEARVDGRAVGSFGDAGLYSFDKGKNITSLQGGVLVTNSDRIARELQTALADLAPPAATTALAQFGQLLVYATLLRPSLYWIPANLPFLGLGQTPYTLTCPMTRYRERLAVLALSLFERIESITAERVAVARRLAAALAPHSALRPIAVPSTAVPVFLRFPLLARDTATRDALLAALTRFGASRSYPQALADLPPLRPQLVNATVDTPGARRVAATLITPPTHAYVTPAHVERIAATVDAALARVP